MKKLAIIIISSVLFSGCNINNYLLKKPAGLEIVTDPLSRVYVNGEDKGTTPFKSDNIKPGNYTIKLVPEGDTTTLPWEANINLTKQVSTIIHQNLTDSLNTSSGYTLELVKEPDNSKAYISVVTDPNTANISIDSVPYGFTPISKQELEPGTHTLEISMPGHKTISLSLNATPGYNLLVNTKLAQDLILLDPKPATPSSELDPSSDSTSSSTLEGDSYVTIKPTATGWLRVREEPSTLAPEIGKANEGEEFPYLSTSDDGWYEILFEGEEGWISGEYATLVK